MNLGRRLLSFIAAYAAYVVGVHVVEGPWQNWKKTPGVYDNWTWTHVIWGAIAKRWGITLEELTALSVANEGAEYALRQTRTDILFGTEESVGNVARDLVYTALAFELTPLPKT